MGYLAVVSHVHAEDELELGKIVIETGLYLGGSLLHYNLQGDDFDDSIALTDGSEIFDVSDVKNRKGFSAVVGYRA